MIFNNRFFLLLVIAVADVAMGDWSCYDVEGVINNIAHQCYCEPSHCNEDTCVNDGGIWTEGCGSCHCDENQVATTDTSITGDGCYDQDINTCICDSSVCSEGTCSASGGQWSANCRSCQCAGTGAPTGGAFCFSEWATVEVLQKNTEQESATEVAMKELRIGDIVKTAPGRYQPVYAFGHFHESKLAEFLQIHTAAAKTPLEITGSHFIFIEGKGSPVRADSVRVGDVVHYSAASSNSASVGAVVTNISKVTRRGIYAPLTSDGTVIVNGIKASTYAIISSKSSTNHVEVAGWSFFGLSEANAIHLALSPLRLLCSGSTFDICKEIDEETKMNTYVAWGTRLIHLVEAQNGILQFIVAAIAVSIFALIWTFEKAYGLDSFFVSSACLLAVAFYRSASSKIVKKV
jgi:hypothetical protein